MKLTPFTTCPVVNIQTGMILFVNICCSSTNGPVRYRLMKFFRDLKPHPSLLFSGWNWQANTLSLLHRRMNVGAVFPVVGLLRFLVSSALVIRRMHKVHIRPIRIPNSLVPGLHFQGIPALICGILSPGLSGILRSLPLQNAKALHTPSLLSLLLKQSCRPRQIPKKGSTFLYRLPISLHQTILVAFRAFKGPTPGRISLSAAERFFVSLLQLAARPGAVIAFDTSVYFPYRSKLTEALP